MNALPPPAIYCQASLSSLVKEDAALDAIAMYESNNVDKTVGAKGELGRWQLSYDTWRIYTDASFDLAFDYKTANRVARTHFEFLAEKLQHMADSPESLVYLIAAAWCSGWRNVNDGYISPGAVKEAESVVNLYISATTGPKKNLRVTPKKHEKSPDV